ncbi:MAG: hypothetical protein J6D27_05205 [Ruminiclostridium sp.]|nr:hypothetical protein [Ruminiclostridium sp.]
MSEKNSGGNKTPAILGTIAALIAAFFGITIPTNFFGGGNEAASSVPTSSKVESVDSSVNENSSETEITVTSKPESSKEEVFYYFRNQGLYDSHYEKHGHEFGNITKEEYLQKANDLINSDSPDVLTKYEDDGDFMYFDKKSGEFLVLSPDGYIRTFFIPDDGIDYWNRQ